jgi:uncharacterized protein YcfJ
MAIRIATTSTLLSALLIAGIAHADPHPRRHRAHYVDYDHARVVHVDPLWRNVRVEAPRETCWTETRYVEHEVRRSSDATGAAIVGGVVGAAIGHEVARHGNRVPATVAGALVGSAVGYQIGRSDERVPRVDAVPVERCEVVRGRAHVRRLDGYRVTYLYAGRRYTEVMPYDPGRRVRVRIAGRPQIVG